MAVNIRNAAGTLVAWATRSRADGSEIQQVEVVTAVPAAADFQSITVPTTAGGVTLASLCAGGVIPGPGGQPATHALFRVDSAGGTVYWVDDGGTPTATDAFPAAAGEFGEWVNLSQVKLIASSSTAVRVSFRRY